ncbi:MAG: MBL fold metallo-hydrolase [Candidatus Coprovivens sp.]
MKTCVLASGSEGNVTYIETQNHKILFDLGTNVKYIKERLSELSVLIEDIDYVFITHVHDDHVKALKGFIKKYHPKICVSSIMYSELDVLKEYDNIQLYENLVELTDAKVEILKTSHDTTDARSFIIRSENKSIVYMTDTGYINKKYFRQLYNNEVYLFESNHDIEMLLNGPYPKWLKDRVMGPKGHLSNKDSSIYLAKLVGDKTKKIILTHLSHKNNTEEKAIETIKETFKEYDVNFDDISCAKQKEKSELITI